MPEWFGGSATNPRSIIPESDQWVLQWNRMARWAKRVSDIELKSKTQEIDEYDHDTIIAFFQNCFHLGDWIRSTHPELEQAWYKFQNNHVEIGACRDICNGYKHRTLNKPSHDKDFNFYCTYDAFAAAKGETGNHVKWMIAFEKGSELLKYDVFVFSNRLKELLQKFIEETGLKKTLTTFHE